MPITFRCVNCGQEKQGNYRLKDQEYCGDTPCQRARRRAYQKNRMASDPAYRQSQKACRKAWREKHARAQYQASYRDAHPEYVERNRQQQRQRNRKRCALPVSHRGVGQAEQGLMLTDTMIVKMNACNSIKSGIYILTPCQLIAPSRMIVKMNSFMAELSIFQKDNTGPPVSSK